jgi:hypothetical protein
MPPDVDVAVLRPRPAPQGPAPSGPAPLGPNPSPPADSFPAASGGAEGGAEDGAGAPAGPQPRLPPPWPLLAVDARAVGNVGRFVRVAAAGEARCRRRVLSRCVTRAALLRAATLVR